MFTLFILQTKYLQFFPTELQGRNIKCKVIVFKDDKASTVVFHIHTNLFFMKTKQQQDEIFLSTFFHNNKHLNSFIKASKLLNHFIKS